MRLPNFTRLWLLAAMALLFPLAVAAAPASDADRDAAKAAVDATVDSVMAVLNDEALPIEQKRDAIEAIAYERFDFNTISKLVLARNWRRMTPAQREQFEQEFKRHLSVTYGDSLDRYGEETVEITDSRAERNGDVTVRTRILGEGDPLGVDYRLRSRNGSWYVIDVIVEGVSLLSNFRSQTQEIISAEGPEGLIQKLREKNEGREG
jgi:phospholipid transport system substrate-binding protein